MRPLRTDLMQAAALVFWMASAFAAGTVVRLLRKKTQAVRCICRRAVCERFHGRRP